MAVSFETKNLPTLKEDDVKGLGLKEVSDRLATTGQQLHELFQEFKQTDGKISAEEAAAIKLLNENMGVLKPREQELIDQERALKQGQEEYERHSTPNRRKGIFPETRGDNDGDAYIAKSIGEAFVGSDAFKHYESSRRWSPVATVGDEEAELKSGEKRIVIAGKSYADMRGKALIDTTMVPTQTSIGLVTPDNRGLLPVQTRRLVIADLIPQGNTNSNAISYMEETGFTFAGDFVAEGGTKPESGPITFTQKSVPVRKLATVLPVTDELFEDAPAMRSYLNARLMTAMELREEDALLTGTGVAPEFTGILNTAGIQTRAKGTDPAPDAIYRAMVDVQVNALTSVTGSVWNPLDWVDVKLLRTNEGVYIWGNPDQGGPDRIWGLNVVQTPAMTQNTVLMADFATSMMLFRRSGLAFSVSDQHADFFIKNQLMIRVEERLTLVVFRPAAIITVTGM